MRVVIDIETMSDPAAFDREVSFLTPPKSYKSEEAINKWSSKQKKSLKEKMALKNSARIMVVGIKTPEAVIIMHQLPISKVDDGLNTLPFPDEASLLHGVAQLLAALTDPEFITFNGWAFDFPKLRLGMARHGIEVPDVLFTAQHHDLMRTFHRKYSVSPSNKWPSMNEVLENLGIPCKPMNGNLFGMLVEAGRHQEAILYNAIDLVLTESIYHRIGE